MKLNKIAGFTLIELLVVVLIIGILATVALPQYNKAVKRAQGSEVLLALNTLDKALQAYALEHGHLVTGYSMPAEELNVQIPDLNYFLYAGDPHSKQFHGIYMANLCRIVKPEKGITIETQWDSRTGARNYSICYGSDCGTYFDCNFTEEPYYPCGGPNRGCSASGTQTTCYLDN